MLLTDRVSVLCTGITSEVILITVVETVEKVKNKYYKLEANYQLLPDFIRLRLSLKFRDVGR